MRISLSELCNLLHIISMRGNKSTIADVTGSHKGKGYKKRQLFFGASRQKQPKEAHDNRIKRRNIFEALDNVDNEIEAKKYRKRLGKLHVDTPLLQFYEWSKL